MIECLLLGRHGIGVDTNPAAINISRGRIEGLKEAARSQRYSLPKVKTVLTLGDARDLHFIRSGAVSLICAHPPYLGSIKYSKWIHNDLSRITQPTEYLKEFDKIASEFLRILRPGGYCAIMLGDVRKEGKYIPLGLRAMRVFEENAFRLEELVIKDQERASFDEFYSKKSFLRIAHEYVLVFRK